MCDVSRKINRLKQVLVATFAGIKTTQVLSGLALGA